MISKILLITIKQNEMYFSIKIEHSSLCGEECSLSIFFDIFHLIYIFNFIQNIL